MGNTFVLLHNEAYPFCFGSVNLGSTSQNVQMVAVESRRGDDLNDAQGNAGGGPPLHDHA